MAQLDMFDIHDDLLNESMKNLIALQPSTPHVYFNADDHDLHQYDIHVVAISTGKDCMALMCKLLEGGIHPSKIIAMHHLVDDAPENQVYFDWHYVEDYYEKLCDRLGIRKAYAYLNGGIYSEILKENTVSDDIIVVKPNGEHVTHGRPRAQPNTRLKFPQVVADLRTRWCSSLLKIEPGQKFMRSMDEEFIGKKIAFHTGERRQESSGRSKYNQLELHATDTSRRSKNPRINRYVDHYRLVLNYSEEDVWETLKNFQYVTDSGECIQGLLPAPAYALFPRSSCALCIFNSDRAYSTLYQLDPERIEKTAALEDRFGVTIARPKKNSAGLNVLQRAKSSDPFEYWDEEAVNQCFKKEYSLPIFESDTGRKWKIPYGAFKEGCGAI